MREEIEAAYQLIADYKRGAIEPGSNITAEQEHLIRMLADDLQVEWQDVSIDRVVPMVAKADSKWNRRTMTAVIRFYELRDSGQLLEAQEEREAFIRECPSVWYCGILGSL